MPIPGYPYHCRKIGGIWFLRIGRWQLSFCACRQAIEPRPIPMRNMRDLDRLMGW